MERGTCKQGNGACFGGAPKSIVKFDDGTEQDVDLKFAAIDVTGKATDATVLKKLTRTGPVGVLYQGAVKPGNRAV